MILRDPRPPRRTHRVTATEARAVAGTVQAVHVPASPVLTCRWMVMRSRGGARRVEAHWTLETPASCMAGDEDGASQHEAQPARLQPMPLGGTVAA